MPAGKPDSDQEILFSIELLTIQQTGPIPVVKFGNRTYHIPTGAVIKQLRQAGYEHLMEPKNDE